MYQVQKFTYNGFMGQTLNGLTKYTAEFVEWTDDPGVAKFKCSDNKERLIPTFAIIDWKGENHPEQVIERDEKTGMSKTLFGKASSSD